MTDVHTAYRALGFSEAPFSITPDTEFFFPTPQYVAALKHLRFGIESGGFTLLTAEVGLGKTLLCRQVLRTPHESRRIAYVLDPLQSYEALLAALIRDLTGEMPEDRDPGALLHQLHQVVLDLAQQGERVAIMVDEAHRLAPELLEGLRLLSNLETEKAKLVSLLLVGQPELDKTLSLRAMRPLTQRISVRCHLHPFTLDETRQYIRHRLRVAAPAGAFEFTGFATRVIHRASKGVPRRINQICDRALLLAFAQSRLYVNAWMAHRAAREVKGSWL